MPSAPGVRTRLIQALGRWGFHLGYSLLSLLTLGMLIGAYRAAGPQPWLYPSFPVARIVALPAMLIATSGHRAHHHERAEPDRPNGFTG